MLADADFPPQPARPGLVRWLVLLAGVAFAGLMALGIWQVQRLQWKLALIERVEHRAHAAPVATPGQAEWAAIKRESNEYTRVQVSGVFDHSRETLVRASTELGSGFWVLTPLHTTAGFWVLVNRGFVSAANRTQASRPGSTAQQSIAGLLRLSEPGGSFLQHNDVAAGRWYSRDVQAIAASVGLDARPGAGASVAVAPYFIDAPASQNTQEWPRGGLTVLSFYNNHVIYAVTWFVLAAMVAAAAAYLLYTERQLRASSPNGKQDKQGEVNVRT